MVCSAGTAQFEGMERDLQITPDMGILWGDSFGGPPVPVFKWGSTTFVHDVVDFAFTAWTGQTNSGNIEAYLPGYAPGWKFDLWLPGQSSVAAFPGFGNWDATSQTWQIKNCILTKPIESKGQKAPIVPLWGYRFEARAAASGYGSWLNERGAVSPVATSVPALLATKFVAHQIQDWSLSALPLPMQSGVVYTGVQHGRRRDAAVAFDHCSAADMDALILWYRYQAAGAGPFTLATTVPFGPGLSPYSCQAWPTKLTVTRVSGFWEAKLEMSLYV